MGGKRGAWKGRKSHGGQGSSLVRRPNPRLPRTPNNIGREKIREDPSWTSLVVQWLRLHASTAGPGLGWDSFACLSEWPKQRREDPFLLRKEEEGGRSSKTEAAAAGLGPLLKS